MAFMGNLLGGNNQFQAGGANQGQLDTAYGNTQEGIQKQRDLLAALQAQNGIGNQSSVFNQLQGVASGQGPNPAQAMLNNATGANVANQAALMAGQRGSSANAGLMARQAGQQGAGIQQNAVGQGAALQAQQSLGALGQMGGIAGQQVGQQMQGVQGFNQAAQGQQSNLMNMMANQNNINAKTAEENAKRKSAGIGGLFGGIGGALAGPVGSMLGGGAPSFGAGSIPGLGGGMPLSGGSYAKGGEISAIGKENYGPRSSVGRHLKGISNYAAGGKVEAKVSPGEIYLTPEKARAVAHGKASPMSGEHIPGKAKVKGDSLKNDTVSKTLKEGGVVIPRSQVNTKDPKRMAAFTAAHLGLAKKKK